MYRYLIKAPEQAKVKDLRCDFSFLKSNQRARFINIGGEMGMNNNGDEECVMKIGGAGNGFAGFTRMMPHHLNTLHLLADTFG